MNDAQWVDVKNFYYFVSFLLHFDELSKFFIFGKMLNGGVSPKGILVDFAEYHLRILPTPKSKLFEKNPQTNISKIHKILSKITKNVREKFKTSGDFLEYLARIRTNIPTVFQAVTWNNKTQIQKIVKIFENG